MYVNGLTVYYFRYLESYLEEVHAASNNISKLYETIQHAGNIIPRLYLLITIGFVP